MSDENIIEVKGLKVHFPVTEGLLKRTVGWNYAVDGVSFNVRCGETFSLVGESGCGKSTIALSVLRMQDVTAGNIVFNGEDITHHSANQLRPIRRQVYLAP